MKSLLIFLVVVLVAGISIYATYVMMKPAPIVENHDDIIGGLDNVTISLDKYAMVFDHHANRMRKRIVISKKELLNYNYDEWREFAERLEVHVGDWKALSLDHREIAERTKVINIDVVKAIHMRKGEPLEMFDARTKASIPYIESDYKKLYKKWMHLQKKYIEVDHKNNKIITESNEQVQKYKEMIDENGEGWSSAEKIVKYILPTLLAGGTGALLGGPLGFMLLGGATPTVSGIWHLVDTLCTKPEKNKDYAIVGGRFRVVGTEAEKLGYFISDNLASIKIILAQISKIKGNIQVLSGGQIRKEFVDALRESIVLVHKYNEATIDKHFINKITG